VILSVDPQGHSRSRGRSALEHNRLAVDLSDDGEAKPRARASSFAELGQRAANHLRSGARMVPGLGVGLELGRFAIIAAVFLACAGVCYKLWKKIDCNSRRCDPRTWSRCIPRMLMKSGWDEFEGFRITVTVHSIKDVANKSLLGGSNMFKVAVNFRWSRFKTAATQDMRFEQTKGMEIPQGATECEILLVKEGKIKDSTIGSCYLETKREMLDRSGFFGTKQNIKLESNSKPVGTLLVTFNKLAPGEEPEGAEALFPGIAEDSPLNVELLKVKGEGPNLSSLPQDDEELGLLARVLTGTLREVDKKGKEEGKSFCAFLKCNAAELQGEKVEKALAKAKEKAAKKGEEEISKKWYWCWYKDDKAAEKNWGHPDGFLPVVAITSVHRSPERTDQFILKYSQGSKKDALIYRRETGKGLDVWIDGIELMFSEVRKSLKEKETKELMAKKMKSIHKDFLTKKGAPQSAEDWEAWDAAFQKQGFPKDEIARYKEKVQGDGGRVDAEGAEASGSRGRGADDDDDDD